MWVPAGATSAIVRWVPSGARYAKLRPAPSSQPSSPSTDDLDGVWIVVEAIAIPPVQVPDFRVPEITADTGQAGWP
jgi:hypothetical protein